MIEIAICESANGRYRFRAEGYPEISGSSRQPLLDACRALKSLGVDPSAECGLFREGKTTPDMTTTVADGARWAVEEPDRGRVKFKKYQEFTMRVLEDA